LSSFLAKLNPSLYLRNKRERKRRRRQLREWKADRAREDSRRAFDKAFGHRSKIIDLLAACGSVGPALEHRGRLRFVVPDRFSVIDDTARTLDALSRFARAMRAHRVSSVFIDFSRMASYDLGANGLLDILIQELAVEARRNARTVRWRGTFPAGPAHARFVRALGVIKRLRVAHEYPTREDAARLVMFDQRSRHYVRALRPQFVDKKSRVTASFADHINRCLHTIGRALSLEARMRLCTYVGEVIDNAEQHAGMLDWAIQGYLDTQLETPMCEVVIFNFGRTIAETFEALPADSFTRQQIQRYIELHGKRRLFDAAWRKEDLYTLIALQGNVSSKNESATDTRGNGTVDLIDFFQRVHAECSGASGAPARMVIVSGSTRVLFDGKYAMTPNQDGIRVIAFNSGNDLEDRPDRDYVGKLDGVEFPGTLIGLQFPLSTAQSTVAATGESP
jgi:hypothetical protein